MSSSKQTTVLSGLTARLGWRWRALRAGGGEAVMHRVQVLRKCEAHGSEYGGYFVVPDGLNSDAVVYSFGVGEDVSFDLSLINQYGLSVFAFDPTPKSVAWLGGQVLPPQFHHYAHALGTADGVATFFEPKDPNHVSHSLVRRGPQPGHDHT